MAEEGLFGAGVDDPPDGLDGVGWEGWAILLVVPGGLAAVAFLISVSGVRVASIDGVVGGGGGSRVMDPTRLAIGLALAVVFLVTALLLARHEDEG